MKLHCGAFSEVLGCTTYDDEYTHIGMLFVRKTACGKSLNKSLISDTVEITCPTCEAEIAYRKQHPSARQDGFGICHIKEDKHE